MSLTCIFFDVSCTLGVLDGHDFYPYADTAALLAELRAQGLRLGVVSAFPRTQVCALLEGADLLQFFDPRLVLSMRDGSIDQDSAVAAAGVAIHECMFVGDAQRCRRLAGR